MRAGWSGAERLALRLHRLRSRRQPPQQRIEVGDRPALRAQRMKRARQLGAVLVGQRLHDGATEELVRALIELRDCLDGFEGPLIRAFEAIQARGDLFQTQFDES